jgi:hypothetical protein
MNKWYQNVEVWKFGLLALAIVCGAIGATVDPNFFTILSTMFGVGGTGVAAQQFKKAG